MISTDELNLLGKQKQELLKSFDRKEMTEEMFKEKLSGIEKRVNEITSSFVNNVIKKQEENTMAEEAVKEVSVKAPKEKKPKAEKVEGAKRGKKSNETSLASFVAKALQMKTVKNKDDAVAKLCEWVPSLTKEKAAARISAIIAAVKKQQGRWVGCSWDEATYQLTLKQ